MSLVLITITLESSYRISRSVTFMCVNMSSEMVLCGDLWSLSTDHQCDFPNKRLSTIWPRVCCSLKLQVWLISHLCQVSDCGHTRSSSGSPTGSGAGSRGFLTYEWTAGDIDLDSGRST